VFGLALVVGIRWLYLKFRGIEAIGLGDGKLLLMIGIFGGPMAVAWALGAGALQGLLVSIPMLLTGRNPANSDLQEVHGEDPTLGEEDPDAGVMGKRVPFGPFLALAGLEWVLLRRQIEALFGWLMGT
jgi:leader peptidase (prepilin peptidase)/N-methyltransferase